VKPTLDPRVRRAGLIGALLLTLAAARWVGGEADVPSSGAVPAAQAQAQTQTQAQPAARPRAEGRPAAPAPALDLGRLKGRGGKVSADAFEAKSWDPPAPRLTARERAQRELEAYVPPPAPQAPPLPFRYVGMLGDDDATTVFLSVGDRDLAARVGDTIDGSYRLESADGRNLVFTYLPLGQQQTLYIATP
jgi:hypothetical protein